MTHPGIPPSERKLMALDPAKCHPHKSNRRIRDEDLADLLEDIRVNGIQFPASGAPHPTIPNHYELACGNRRGRCCQILEIPLPAYVQEFPYVPGQAVKLSVSDHLKRKNPDPFEVCEEVTAYKRDLGLKTWAEVAKEEHLNLSPPTLSRILGVKRYTPELRAKTEGLGGTIIQIIGKLPSLDMMAKALDFANGQGVTKEMVERFIKQLKGENRPGPKRKTLSGKIDGRSMSISLKEGETTEALATWLEMLAAKFKKHKDLPPDSLGGLFA